MTGISLLSSLSVGSLYILSFFGLILIEIGSPVSILLKC